MKCSHGFDLEVRCHACVAEALERIEKGNRVPVSKPSDQDFGLGNFGSKLHTVTSLAIDPFQVRR